ncbi:MAG: RpiB/LacA/LacB family sugar-phosphate isomerase [Clostridiales bacterium]|nr:RpiB/LacA/LacB family sugar-phosphate isomerase [Clostridiales bacterium]
MNPVKIAFGCDIVGFELKEIIRQYLVQEKNAQVVIDPVQTPEQASMLFTDQLELICTGIQRDECRLAILICGTGLGFCTVANTYWGIRAAHASDCYTAERARKSLNAQVLCIGARVLAPEYAKKVVSAWFDEPFSFDRKSSVYNLKLMEDAQYKRMPKPAHVAWSMGFDPADADPQPGQK